jgi:hypothetical protein
MIPDPAPNWWPEHLEVADKAVVVAGLDPFIEAFLAAAAALHWTLFSLPLIVTSARDSIHGTGSKHYVGKAADIRSRDLTVEQANDFAQKLVPLQAGAKVGIFDERFIGSPHWHVETA